MPSVNITSDRVAQVDTVIRKFVQGFLKPLDTEEAVLDFESVFSSTVSWYDHAFLVQRVGHEAVIGLQKSFRYCNDPFNVEIKNIIPTTGGAILEQVWVGRCANDIVRPDGEIAVKGTGKDFKCHVCMVIGVDEAGKITRIDEYYNKLWDNGIREEDYTVMKGASLKEVVRSSI